MSRIPNGIFGDYNPYTVPVAGDWYFAPDPVHTGEVYLNGKAMYEALKLEDVLHPAVNPHSWDPEGSLFKWYTEQDGNVTVLYANFRGADPNAENVEINVRRNCVYPSKEGIGYITVRGIWLDWQAQGARVTGNLFHDNTPPEGTEITPLLGLGEDIFLEVSHGPTLFDNNVMLSPCTMRLSTQGYALVHNLIAGGMFILITVIALVVTHVLQGKGDD